MALRFVLRVNDQAIGSCEIRRTAPLTDVGPDTVCTYDVRIDGQIRATVQHRYGDGPWRLVAIAMQSAAPPGGP